MNSLRNTPVAKFEIGDTVSSDFRIEGTSYKTNSGLDIKGFIINIQFQYADNIEGRNYYMYEIEHSVQHKNYCHSQYVSDNWLHTTRMVLIEKCR